MSAGRRWELVAGALLVLAAAAVIYAGIYNIAADVPHTPPVYWLLETIRGRSVAARSRDIVVPKDLDDANRISKGAGQYAEMCSGCHLAPGMKRTEISRGLYPRIPQGTAQDHNFRGNSRGQKSFREAACKVV
jgi:cytochrome c553